MNAAAELMDLLAEWRRITELEGQSIRRDDWNQVAQQQRRKAQLQDPITRALNQVRAGSPDSQARPEPGESPFQSVAAELMAMESRNRELLRDKRRRKRAELDQMNLAARNLHGVRRAYGAPSASLWQSYS
jgi:hypothetical protein